jgi:trans-aconitate methyltransferase
MQTKPFSQSCENNKNPIFSIVGEHFKCLTHIVEIGSGTGQHAEFFTERLPHLIWQTTDQGDYFPKLEQLITEINSERLPPALYLDVSQENWSINDCECIFTSNTLHIMPWGCVEQLFAGLSSVLKVNGHFYVYGPFNYDGKFTSESNRSFDLHLKSNNEFSGIRDFEKIISLATHAGLELQVDHPMPANNRLLHFKRK